MDIKYIQKNERGSTSTGSTSVSLVNPNIITQLYGSNITIDGTNQSLLVTKGSLITQVVLREITVWDLSDSSITITTGDPTTLQLRFVNPTERNIALTILENAMNL